MPTRKVYQLLGSSAALFLPGVFLCNLILLCMAPVPIFFLLAGLAVVQPKNVELKRSPLKGSVIVGEVLEQKIDVEVKDGLGTVVIAGELPEEFELVSGSNFKVIWKGSKPKRDQIVYSFRCTKRGSYDLSGVKWESIHPLGLRQTEFGALPGQKMMVRPRLFDIRKARSPNVMSRIPFPSAAVAKVGPVTIDFKELRQYSHGDPFKFINWKATARISSRGRFLPIVNDYDREGMKIVWVLLDRSSTMAAGPSVNNVFEHAVTVAYGLTYYYLRRGCRVGLCVYGGRPEFLYPDVGNRQYHIILKELLRLKPEAGEEERGGSGENPRSNLKDAVKLCRGYLSSYRPLFIVATRFSGENAAALLDGIKEIAKLTGTAGPRLPIMVVNISGYGLAARSGDEKEAARVLWVESVLASRRFHGKVAWVNWDPTRASFTSALLAQVVRR